MELTQPAIQSGGESSKKELLLTSFHIFFAEFFATGMYMYVGCSGSVVGFGAFTFGPALCLACQTVGHISGAHLNPAVTIAALIMGEVKLIYVPVYIVAEFIGAFAGYGLLWSTTFINMSEEASLICVTRPKEIHVSQAVFVEVILTSALIMMYCALWRSKSNISTVGALVLGISMTAFQQGFRPFTGASLNTARSLAPSVVNLKFLDIWVYFLGPNLGAVIGALIYKYILIRGPLTALTT